MKIRAGDTVKVMAGRDRGKTGKVEQVLPSEDRVVVEGVNRFKKHVKPSTRYAKGGIVDIVRPLSVGNVMVICPHCSKLTRVGFKVTDDKKIRVCKKCGKALDEKSSK